MFCKIKMTDILIPIFRVGINALGFVGTNYAFAKSGRGGRVAEYIQNDLEKEKLQGAKDKLNEDRIKRLNFSDKMLHQEKEAKAYISNVDESMLEYCRLFPKRVKPLPLEPQLSDFYHPS